MKITFGALIPMMFTSIMKMFRQLMPLTLSIMTTLCLIRVYEYVAIASKVFVDRPFRFELTGLLYDVWLGCIISFLFFIPFGSPQLNEPSRWPIGRV